MEGENEMKGIWLTRVDQESSY